MSVLHSKVSELKKRNARLEMLASTKHAAALEQEIQHLKGENANLKEVVLSWLKKMDPI